MSPLVASGLKHLCGGKTSPKIDIQGAYNLIMIRREDERKISTTLDTSLM